MSAEQSSGHGERFSVQQHTIHTTRKKKQCNRIEGADCVSSAYGEELAVATQPILLRSILSNFSPKKQ
jgi:hypothetical protein